MDMVWIALIFVACSCVLEYEAEGGPTAAAEIIGKIKYIKTHAT